MPSLAESKYLFTFLFLQMKNLLDQFDTDSLLEFKVVKSVDNCSTPRLADAGRIGGGGLEESEAQKDREMKIDDNADSRTAHNFAWICWKDQISGRPALAFG